jgi:hypothetical protein
MLKTVLGVVFSNNTELSWSQGGQQILRPPKARPDSLTDFKLPLLSEKDGVAEYRQGFS